MDDLLKLGVVGSRRGASLAATCAESTGIRVVALCDSDAAAARHASLPMYSDLDALLEHDIDAVLLANYFHEHAGLAIRCLQAGKHVLSETTACFTLAEGVALIEAVENSGCTYMLAENYPYMRHNQEMRRLYDAGTIGTFRYGEGEYVHPMSSAEADSLAPGENHWRNWLPVTYYSTHSLAPLVYITGCEPVRVNGFAITDDGNDPNRARTRRRMDLAGAIMVTMADGAVAKLLQYDLRGEGNWTRVHGTAGLMENARFGQPGSVRVRREVFDKKPGEPVERLYLPDFPRHHDAATAAGHGGGDYFVLLEFAEAVRTGRRPFFDVYRAVAMSAVGSQAWRSCLESGAPQPIPDFHDPAVRARYAGDTFSPDPASPNPVPVRIPRNA
ncbi:MAG TPA: Gfo/Idh/MocA family oxidoreductase [Mycobacteriales bacterium]|nr:Gfo/Idh/MocA family oxidoreductase [Mycobacteriales bacterium]